MTIDYAAGDLCEAQLHISVFHWPLRIPYEFPQIPKLPSVPENNHRDWCGVTAVNTGMDIERSDVNNMAVEMERAR